MFHTPIDRGHRGAWSKIKHLFFFFSTQCANGSPPPGVKINQMSSSFLILSAEQPPGTVLPSSITAVELGKGEDQWLYPQLCLTLEEMFETELRMLPGRATRWAEMMPAGI